MVGMFFGHVEGNVGKLGGNKFGEITIDHMFLLETLGKCGHFLWVF